MIARSCTAVRPLRPRLSGGTYRGDSVSFQLAVDLKTISHLEIDFNGQCPAGTTTRIQIARSGPFGVQTDKTFSLDEQEANGDKVKLSGAIQNGGQATGTFGLQTATCDTGSVTWTASSTRITRSRPRASALITRRKGVLAPCGWGGRRRRRGPS